MADGRPFNPIARTCAMRYEPLGESVEIINSENGRHAFCLISDRGPYVGGRVVDVSPAVRDTLGFEGLVSVRIFRVARSLLAELPCHITSGLRATQRVLTSCVKKPGAETIWSFGLRPLLNTDCRWMPYRLNAFGASDRCCSTAN
jgi:rare lipoprotein A